MKVYLALKGKIVFILSSFNAELDLNLAHLLLY